MVARVKYHKVPVEAEEHYHRRADGRGEAFHVVLGPNRFCTYFSGDEINKTDDKSKTYTFTFGGNKKRTKNNFGWLMFPN